MFTKENNLNVKLEESTATDLDCLKTLKIISNNKSRTFSVEVLINIALKATQET